jgi:lipoprotein-anchoring transpeptidase ErfK/SrfK
LRIEVDKEAKVVRAFGPNDELVAFYPASIGSHEKPAPKRHLQRSKVVENPTYHYDPRFKFKGVRARRKLTIAPGPNNPVGPDGLTSPRRVMESMGHPIRRRSAKPSRTGVSG